MHLFRLTILTATAAGLALAAPAAARSVPSPSGLLVADGGFGGVLAIERHDVRVTINNGIAVTVVDQVFRNEEDRIVEALYTFPVPKNASVADFTMWIAGKEMVGEVVEKQRAREIYESYKRRGIDPGLLEQVDYKAFEMRIFPIAARAEQRVRITYYQELDVDHDCCTYTYPLATSTRKNVDTRVQGRFSLTLEVKSEVPISEMQSSSHATDLVAVEHGPRFHEASLESSGDALARDVVVSWKLARPKTGIDVITSRQAGEPGYALFTLTAGEELEKQNTGMDFVFISDVSGSMARDGKLQLSQQSVRAFLDALGKKDRFELISFNLGAETLFGKLSAHSPDALERARAFLGGQVARGSTRLRPAIEAAYRYLDADRQLNVVVLSDGMTEEKDRQQLLQLISSRPSGVRVFCIGVGNEIHRPLLRQMAQDTGGLASFVSRGDDFERRARAFRRKLVRPAISDVRLSFDGCGVTELEPQRVPDLYHGQPIRIYTRFAKAGPCVVTMRGTVLGAAVERRFELDLSARDDENPEIERMWAWHRVQRLLDDERLAGETGRHVPEIVRLCEGYSIPSEYASFLVLENDAEYRRWKIERRNATRVARDRRAQQRLREKLDAMRDAAARKLGPDAEPDPVAATTEAGAEAQRERSAATPAQPLPDTGSAPEPRRRRSRWSRSSGSGHGGAVDPITGLFAMGMVAAAAGAARRRRRKSGETRDER